MAKATAFVSAPYLWRVARRNANVQGEIVTSSELQKFRRRVGDFVLQMCRYALDLPEMRLARRPW